MAPTEKTRDEDTQLGDLQWEHDEEGEPSDSTPNSVSSRPAQEKASSSSLAEVFGYYGQSNFNTMALVRMLVHEDDSPDPKDIIVPSASATDAHKTMEKMMDRPILDFLVRFFVAEVNWLGSSANVVFSMIDQVLYPPWFLGQYQKWWKLNRLSTVSDIEFLILILRVCHYASQFLPSPTYTIDSIKGVALAEIRKSCEEAISALFPICARLDPRGSLIRIHHIVFAGLTSMCMGRVNAFWEALSCAIRVAQQISLHQDTAIWASDLDELEKEMRRRTFCNLYIWDSCLSNRLDRIPFLPDVLRADIMPRMHLLPNSDIGADAPDIFTERILRTQLVRFWRTDNTTGGPECDAIAAEDRYERFCSTFLREMPPAFALQPDRQWDERLPMLPMQRQLLHMAIFESLCWNFRPTVFQGLEQVRQLPAYKQVLVLHNKKALAAATLNLLEAVSTLHTMMGGAHTRYAGIVIPAFEAAVPLLCLCKDASFPGESAENGLQIMKTDPLGVGIASLTRAACMQAARDTQTRLQNLAEVSSMADVGARTLARLINRVESSNQPSQEYDDMSGGADVVTQASAAWACDQMREYAIRVSQTDLSFDHTGYVGVGSNWGDIPHDLNSSSGLENLGIFEPGYS
ncbi:MAG: hypothetical protein M1820_005017 [Bogoriella megaspora]|nr:MAG: hypothetical protein M1820_005017 [Bogoriella megaspora]